MRPSSVVRAALVYFALVFATGFALGTIRVLFVVPKLGVRWAELLELPVMLLASAIAARFCMRRFGPFPTSSRAAIGAMALVLLVGAELGMAALQSRSVADYIAGRDPVSGIAYVIALLAFAAMPVLIGRPLRRGSTTLHSEREKS